MSPPRPLQASEIIFANFPGITATPQKESNEYILPFSCYYITASQYVNLHNFDFVFLPQNTRSLCKWPPSGLTLRSDISPRHTFWPDFWPFVRIQNGPSIDVLQYHEKILSGVFLEKIRTYFFRIFTYFEAYLTATTQKSKVAYLTYFDVFFWKLEYAVFFDKKSTYLTALANTSQI